MTEYVPLLFFGAVLAAMLLRAYRTEQLRGERSRLMTLTLVLAAPFALGFIAWHTVSGSSLGEATVNALPLLIFAAASVGFLLIRMLDDRE